jgi:high-affinity K+ transport system ATPase subunit B
MFKRLVLVLCLAFALAAPSFAKGKSGNHKSSTKTTKTTTTTKSTTSTTNTSIVHVHGYVKKDGTVVKAYDRTAPNATKNDNWSTKGNVNPETGVPGTKPRDGEKPPV